MTNLLKLNVRGAEKEDVYKDIVRVNEANRKNDRGCYIIEGSVCKVSIPSNQSEIYAILRGNEGDTTGIKIDEYLRIKLGVEKDKEYDFTLKTRWWYRFYWSWNATDPGYRISSQIATISFLLGVLSIVLAVFI